MVAFRPVPAAALILACLFKACAAAPEPGPRPLVKTSGVLKPAEATDGSPRAECALPIKHCASRSYVDMHMICIGVLQVQE